MVTAKITKKISKMQLFSRAQKPDKFSIVKTGSFTGQWIVGPEMRAHLVDALSLIPPTDRESKCFLGVIFGAIRH